MGVNAARMAVGLGADVSLLDINLDRLRAIDEMFRGRVVTLASNALIVGDPVGQKRNVKPAAMVWTSLALVPYSTNRSQRLNSVACAPIVALSGCTGP